MSQARQQGNGEHRPWLPHRWLPLVLPALAALTVSAPLLFDPYSLLGPDSWRSFDWLETAKLNAYAYTAIREYGTLPFWNPLLQGGLPQFSHPSDSSLSPLFLPTLLLGEAAGMKVTVILALLLGAVGTALLGRDRLGLSPRFAAFAGCAFALAGWLPSRVLIGYYESTLYALFPLILWLLLQSHARPWRLLAATLLTALCALHVHLGMLVLFTLLGLFVVLEVARGAAPRGHLWRLCLLGVGAAGLAAFKLIPMFQGLLQHDLRRVARYDSFGDFYTSMGALAQGLIQLAPKVGVYDKLGEPAQGDFGFVGLGVPLLLLAVVGLASCWRRPRATLTAGLIFVLFTWLCFGPSAPLDLFRALWSLPLFSSLRGALRYYTFGLFLMACLLAAAGLQMLAGAGLARSRVGRMMVAALALVSLAWPGIQSVQRYHISFDRPLAASEPEVKEFHQEQLAQAPHGGHMGGDHRHDRGNTLIYTNLRAGVGTVYVAEDIPAPSVVKGRRVYDLQTARYLPSKGYRGEAFCPDNSCQVLEVLERPNTMVIRARFTGPTTLVVGRILPDLWANMRACSRYRSSQQS